MADVLSLERAKQLYRAGIDAGARDGESAHWWESVRREMEQVVVARSAAQAARVIGWWHHDWSCVGDSPEAAARRIRSAAGTGRR